MSKLTLVGTSIGNIKDLSPRAIEQIYYSDILLAEDTRNIKKLKLILETKYSEIFQSVIKEPNTSQKLLSYRDQNHDSILSTIVNFLKDDKEVALVSDAGMPSISDPGFKLVRDLTEKGFEVDVIPGPTAVTSALVLSGLPTDKYVFLGFLPRKKGKLLKMVEQYIELPVTIVIYESPYRVVSTVKVIAAEYPEIEIAAVAEITKKFQNVFRGSITKVLKELSSKTLKGEWVICLRKTDSVT